MSQAHSTFFFFCVGIYNGVFHFKMYLKKNKKSFSWKVKIISLSLSLSLPLSLFVDNQDKLILSLVPFWILSLSFLS